MGTCQSCKRPQQKANNQESTVRQPAKDSPSLASGVRVNSQPLNLPPQQADRKEDVKSHSEHNEEDFNLHLPEHSNMLQVPTAVRKTNQSLIDLAISHSLFDTELPAESLPIPQAANRTPAQEVPIGNLDAAGQQSAAAQQKGGNEEEEKVGGGEGKEGGYEEVKEDEIYYSRVPPNDWRSVLTRMEEEEKARQKEAAMGS